MFGSSALTIHSYPTILCLHLYGGVEAILKACLFETPSNFLFFVVFPKYGTNRACCWYGDQHDMTATTGVRRSRDLEGGGLFSC